MGEAVDITAPIVATLLFFGAVGGCLYLAAWYIYLLTGRWPW